jgi:hypothetical protein
MAFERGREGSKICVGWAAKLSFFMPYDYQMGGFRLIGFQQVLILSFMVGLQTK